MDVQKIIYSVIIDKEPVIDIVRKLKFINDTPIGIMLIEGRTCGKEPGDGISKVVEELKKIDHEIEVYCDLCVCSETSDGHCRIKDHFGSFDLERTNDLILKKAKKYVNSGTDWLLLSDMNENSVKSVRELMGEFSKVRLGVEYKLKSEIYNVFRSKAGLPRIKKGYHANWPSKERLSKFMEGADALIIKPALLSADVFESARKISSEIKIMSFITNGEAAFIKHMQDEYKFDLLSEVNSFLKRIGASSVIMPQVLAVHQKRAKKSSERIIELRKNREA